MLLDMDLRGKTVLIVGGGKVGGRKARKFLAAGAKVLLASKDSTKAVKRLGEKGKLRLINLNLEIDPSSIETWISKSDYVVAATNNHEINAQIAQKTRRRKTRIHTNIVDNPQLGDFTLPVVSKVGEVAIAVSTGGKSPAMARFLRGKIEEAISNEDVLMVRLQSYARELAKTHLNNQNLRKRVLYNIMRDARIRHLLEHGDFQKAKTRAKMLVNKSVKGLGRSSRNSSLVIRNHRISENLHDR
jgi:precorrin-2 dehydrogenase/sirohydrochlorin ferrochelatase